MNDVNAEPQVDAARRSYARAASHGFGMGQIEAQRYLAELSDGARQVLSGQLIEKTDRVLALAQARPLPVSDYVDELVAKGLLERVDGLERVYQAGFDIGFSAYLVESRPVDVLA